MPPRSPLQPHRSALLPDGSTFPPVTPDPPPPPGWVDPFEPPVDPGSDRRGSQPREDEPAGDPDPGIAGD